MVTSDNKNKRLDGSVCNVLLIFIDPHLTHPRSYYLKKILSGCTSVPGGFLTGHFLLGPGL